MITVLSKVLTRDFPQSISDYDWLHLDQPQDLDFRYLFVVSFDVGYIIDSHESASLHTVLQRYSTKIHTSKIGCSYITDTYGDIAYATQDICKLFQLRKDVCRFGDIQSLQPLVTPICLYVNKNKYSSVQTQVSDSDITITCPTYSVAEKVLQDCMIYTEYLMAIHQCDIMLRSYRFTFEDNKRNTYLYSMSQYRSLLSTFTPHRYQQLFNQLQIQQQSQHLLFFIDTLQATTYQRIQHKMNMSEREITNIGIFISAVTFASFFIQLCTPCTQILPYVSIAAFLFVVIVGVCCVKHHHRIQQSTKFFTHQNQSQVSNFTSIQSEHVISTFKFESLEKEQQRGRFLYHPNGDER